MAIGCAGRCGPALLTRRAGLCYNPAMRHAVCVYPETAEALASAPGDFDLELQSFGLGGVRSPRDWRRRAAFYAALVRRHPGRRHHLHGPFLDLSYSSWDHLILKATRRRIRDTLSSAAGCGPSTWSSTCAAPPTSAVRTAWSPGCGPRGLSGNPGWSVSPLWA